MSKITELYTFPLSDKSLDWSRIVSGEYCRYIGKRCLKVRKSNPDVSIGTCVVKYGRNREDVIICPHRLLQNNRIFFDCLHLLTLHQPGNELHIVPEVGIPGGSVDYFLVSTDENRKIADFVGIELQTLDTTGTLWYERQFALCELGVSAARPDIDKPFGMNWKMTAKTILVQLHHKIQTFQSINKHLVLIVQDPLLQYIKREFAFSHVSGPPRLDHSMQFHSYSYIKSGKGYKLKLGSRYSTDSAGISRLLGLNADANIGLEELISTLEPKISEDTLLTFN